MFLRLLYIPPFGNNDLSYSAKDFTLTLMKSLYDIEFGKNKEFESLKVIVLIDKVEVKSTVDLLPQRKTTHRSKTVL